VCNGHPALPLKLSTSSGLSGGPPLFWWAILSHPPQGSHGCGGEGERAGAQAMTPKTTTRLAVSGLKQVLSSPSFWRWKGVGPRRSQSSSRPTTLRRKTKACARFVERSAPAGLQAGKDLCVSIHLRPVGAGDPVLEEKGFLRGPFFGTETSLFEKDLFETLSRHLGPTKATC